MEKIFTQIMLYNSGIILYFVRHLILNANLKLEVDMSNTRAKFRCQSVTKQEGWGGAKFVYNAKFFVVTGNSEENKQFFASTPTGTIEIGTVREDFFEPGEEYFVDFTKVVKEQPKQD